MKPKPLTIAFTKAAKPFEIPSKKPPNVMVSQSTNRSTISANGILGNLSIYFTPEQKNPELVQQNLQHLYNRYFLKARRLMRLYDNASHAVLIVRDGDRNIRIRHDIENFRQVCAFMHSRKFSI